MSKKGKKKSNLLVVSLVTVLVFALYYLLIMSSIAGVLWISYNSGEKNPDVYRLKVYQGSKDKTKEVESPIMNSDGIVYIPVDAIEKLCPLTLTGTPDQIDITIRATGEIASLTNGSRAITVNGVSAWMTEPAYFEGDTYYVPVDFVSVYMSGLNAELIQAEKICKVSKGITVTEVNFVPGKITVLNNITEPADS